MHRSFPNIIFVLFYQFLRFNWLTEGRVEVKSPGDDKWVARDPAVLKHFQIQKALLEPPCQVANLIVYIWKKNRGNYN
jgi:hypothetical protein